MDEFSLKLLCCFMLGAGIVFGFMVVILVYGLVDKIFRFIHKIRKGREILENKISLSPENSIFLSSNLLCALRVHTETSRYHLRCYRRYLYLAEFERLRKDLWEKDIVLPPFMIIKLSDYELDYGADCIVKLHGKVIVRGSFGKKFPQFTVPNAIEQYLLNENGGKNE